MKFGEVTGILFDYGEVGVYRVLQERVKKMKETLECENRSATLVLGAGISRSAKLPDWKTLLSRLTAMISGMDFERDEAYKMKSGSYMPLTFEEYKDAQPVFYDSDLLEIAEYVYTVFYTQDFCKEDYPMLRTAENPRDEYMKRMVRQALMPVSEGLDTEEGLFSYELLENETVGKIAKLAAAHFIVKKNHPGKRSVITYNYDNLLEHCLTKQVHPVKYQVIFDGNRADREAELHIYHPHGFLPMKGTKEYVQRMESEKIILAESSYYEMEHYSYNWENFVFARALQDSICVFFGFSGNDYNFKRILKNLSPGQIKEERHYLVVAIDDMVERLFFSGNGDKGLSLFERLDELKKRDSRFFHRCRQRLYSYLALKEEYWKAKGFLPVWTTVEDLPGLIDLLLA